MRSSSLRCVSAAEHQMVEQYSKMCKTKPLKHLPRSSLSWNTCQDFLKIPSHWEAALETERRCFSKVILESNVTPNITRSSASFSTVPPIVNAGEWGCVVRDLGTIIVLHYKSFEANQDQAIKHLRQCWCYRNQSVVGSIGGRWTLWNRGDIGVSPASRETTETNKPPKHYTKTRGQNIHCSLKKKSKHTQWVRDTIRVQV